MISLNRDEYQYVSTDSKVFDVDDFLVVLVDATEALVDGFDR